MITAQSIIWQAAVLGKWTARILGSLAVLFFLALVFGEGPPNPFALSLRENLSLVCMLVLFFGLALAWYREGWGGATTIVAFAALVLISQSHLRMPALQLTAAIGALHLICWTRLRLPAPVHSARIVIPRGALAAGATVIGMFLLLCANEIFGNPPLLTPALHPGPALIGTWSSGDSTFTIEPDGSVTGALSGTIRNNRSWFGTLMHWRADFMIGGQALDLRGSELSTGRVRYRRIQ